ncbi:anti-sigma factor [Lachnoclostridium sp. An14]|uniref:anti-sigma factor family protein n=1 Tax=Lachnoclostridium sp. An14 TaxID=1965562 RepID=UPI000B39ADC9|nr:zf-HC2 domain-containing protein [Lachnoclostridium sp. An14]OUQ19760.1 anti-sigma factor [Lachnoclostridium sp. An14]
MTCRETEQMIIPYINGQLEDEELEAFLTHVRDCAECREELEIYFTVDYGIRQLDDDIGVYDIPGALERTLEQSWERIRHVHTLTVLRYVFATLSSLWLAVTFLLQMRIWWQAGMFL